MVGLHITSDAFTALAYYSIPIALFYFVRQRKDLPFKWVFLPFGAFIISCGTTHLIEIWALRYPTYWLAGGMKAVTALISVFTAIELIPLVPKVIALPDSNELQRLNGKLQISQARFAGILDVASDAIISIDANQRITLFNREAEKVFGCTAEEAVGQCIDLLLPQRFAALHHQHISNFKERDGSTRCMGERSEIFGRRKDGSEFPAEAPISKLEVAGEKIFTAFLWGITERKQVEVELQEQQCFLRQMIDGNPRLIFVKDWEGKFTLANQALAETYNTSVEELIGKTDAADFCSNPDDVRQYDYADRQVMQTLEPLVNLEESFTTTDGTTRYFQSIKKPLLSPNGKTRYLLRAATDITALKQIEAALQQKTEELEAFFSSAIDILRIVIAIKMVLTVGSSDDQFREKTTFTPLPEILPLVDKQSRVLAQVRHQITILRQQQQLRAQNYQLQQIKAEFQQANLELQRVANTDSLTQIANRRCFDEALEQEWQQPSREPHCSCQALISMADGAMYAAKNWGRDRIVSYSHESIEGFVA